MIMGKPAFRIPKGQKPSAEVYKKIKIPTNLKSDTKNLLKGLLTLDPKKRLGYGPKGAENIKKHPFFKGINWKNLAQRKVTPPCIPELSDDEDLKYFDKAFTEEPIDDEEEKEEGGRGSTYRGFTYVPGSAANEIVGEKKVPDDGENLTENNPNDNAIMLELQNTKNKKK